MNEVLMLYNEGNEVKQLMWPHEIMSPCSVDLDNKSDKLYISGEDKDDKQFVFIYDYGVINNYGICKETLTKIHLAVEL